jgi:hypothetical protein
VALPLARCLDALSSIASLTANTASRRGDRVMRIPSLPCLSQMLGRKHGDRLIYRPLKDDPFPSRGFLAEYRRVQDGCVSLAVRIIILCIIMAVVQGAVLDECSTLLLRIQTWMVGVSLVITQRP